VWPRPEILAKAHQLAAKNSELQELLEGITDDWDEGTSLDHSDCIAAR